MTKHLFHRIQHQIGQHLINSFLNMLSWTYIFLIDPDIQLIYSTHIILTLNKNQVEMKHY